MSHRNLSILILLGLLLAAPSWADPEPEHGPVGTFGLDLSVQATVSTPMADFWSRYPQYAAQSLPFARLRFGLAQQGDWSIEAEFDFLQQYTAWSLTNLPLPDAASKRTFPVEYHGLRKGDLTYNFHPLQISLGRNKVHWGSTTNSLIISDQVPFLDRLAMKLPMGDWTLDDLIASPETRAGQTWSYDTTTFQVAHRISWHRDGLEIGFTEQAIIDRNQYDAKGSVTQTGAYSLTDFLPVFSIHEADQRPFNSMMILDVAWQLDEWRFAFESGFDDFDARVFGIPDDPIPNIPANILEVGWKKGTWSWRAEVGNTHYLWGNFYGRFNGKAVYHLYLDNGTQELPLTSPYGPGATWLAATFHRDGKLGFDGKAEVWSVARGVSLSLPYASTILTGQFDVYARAHLFVSLTRHDLMVQTGPQVLFAGGTLTGQWYVLLDTTLGSPAPTS